MTTSYLSGGRRALRSTGTAGRPMPPLVRRGLLGLALVGVVAGTFELYAERHWATPVQLIPWVALGVLLLGVLLAALPDGRGAVPARVLAVLVLGAAGYGVITHVLTNFAVGVADPRFLALPLLDQWWLAATKGVGAAPVLAPAVLGQSALVLLLATVGAAAAGGRHAYRR